MYWQTPKGACKIKCTLRLQKDGKNGQKYSWFESSRMSKMRSCVFLYTLQHNKNQLNMLNFKN